MKRITEYIKSNSIRNHIEKHNIRLDMVQAAFIIWYNEDIPFEEKLECYKSIADTYVDMSVDTMENGGFHSKHIESFKNHLYSMIENLKAEGKENNFKFEKFPSIDNPENIFYYLNFEISNPFRRGDIVKAFGHPDTLFCIDTMTYWNVTQARIFKVDNKEYFNCMNDIRKKMMSYPDCMDFGGYELITRNNGDIELWCVSVGDSPLYMDLEFAGECEIKGYSKIMYLCQRFIQNEIDETEQLSPITIIGTYKEIEKEAKCNSEINIKSFIDNLYMKQNLMAGVKLYEKGTKESKEKIEK